MEVSGYSERASTHARICQDSRREPYLLTRRRKRTQLSTRLCWIWAFVEAAVTYTALIARVASAVSPFDCRLTDLLPGAVSASAGIDIRHA